MLTMKFFHAVKEMRRLQMAYRYGANMTIRADMVESQQIVDNMIKQIDEQRESQKSEQLPLPDWFQDENTIHE